MGDAFCSHTGYLYHMQLQYPSFTSQLLTQPNPLSSTTGRMCVTACLPRLAIELAGASVHTATCICDLCVHPAVGGWCAGRDSGHAQWGQRTASACSLGDTRQLMASGTRSGFHHAHCLLLSVRWVDSPRGCWWDFSPGSFKGSNCIISCLGGSGLLPTLFSPPSNKVSQNTLGRPLVSA